MTRARRPVPRRAYFAALVGALYGFLILPAPEAIIPVTPQGVTWFVLSLSLLFVLPLAYHAFTGWALLWIVYLGITLVSAGEWVVLALHLILPITTLVLLLTSGYLPIAKAYQQQLRM